MEQFLRGQQLSARVTVLKAKRCPALESAGRHPLVRAFLASARQTGPVGLHYFCDAAVLAGGGIPSVVFGPGDIAQAHTADEWIEVSQLERGGALLGRFLKSLP
jgi:acetylornithine deacetylase